MKKYVMIEDLIENQSSKNLVRFISQPLKYEEMCDLINEIKNSFAKLSNNKLNNFCKQSYQTTNHIYNRI